MASVTFTIIPIIVFFVILIPILLGVYVYRDAAQRGMNAPLWALVAALAPTFIGIIIYLLVRSSYSDLSCPNCTTTVTEQYVVCPKCGARLKATCANCGFPTEPDWTVCPKCTFPVHGNSQDTYHNSSQKIYETYTPPARKKDLALGRILLMVIVIPILLLVLIAMFSFFAFSATGSSTMNTAYLSEEDYEDNSLITEWINKCNDNPHKAYALRYKTEHGETKATHYLVYRPFANATESFTVHNNVGLFKLDLEVRFVEGNYPVIDENKLICISNYSENFVGLKLFINNQKVDCEISDIDYNPSLFELISKSLSVYGDEK